MKKQIIFVTKLVLKTFFGVDLDLVYVLCVA